MCDTEWSLVSSWRRWYTATSRETRRSLHTTHQPTDWSTSSRLIELEPVNNSFLQPASIESPPQLQLLFVCVEPSPVDRSNDHQCLSVCLCVCVLYVKLFWSGLLVVFTWEMLPVAETDWDCGLIDVMLSVHTDSGLVICHWKLLINVQHP